MSAYLYGAWSGGARGVFHARLGGGGVPVHSELKTFLATMTYMYTLDLHVYS